MKHESTILLVIVLFLLVIIVYLVYFLPKSQEKLLSLHLDSLNNQQKDETSSEELKKATLEANKKIEEISQKLITSEEVNKVLLENILVI